MEYKHYQQQAIILTAVMGAVMAVCFFFFPAPGMFLDGARLGAFEGTVLFLVPYIAIIALILYDERLIAGAVVVSGLIGVYWSTLTFVHPLYIAYVVYTVLCMYLLIRAYISYSDMLRMMMADIKRDFGITKTDNGTAYCSSSLYGDPAEIDRLRRNYPSDLCAEYKMKEMVNHRSYEKVGEEYEYTEGDEENKRYVRDIYDYVDRPALEDVPKSDECTDGRTLLATAAARSRACLDNRCTAVVKVKVLDIRIVVGRYISGTLMPL